MNSSPTPDIQFAVCVNNDGYVASLEIGKLYRLIRDDQAEEHGFWRVVDESGEDYAYAKDRFFPIEIPEALKKTLLSAA
jgi:hypothetical protein